VKNLNIFRLFYRSYLRIIPSFSPSKYDNLIKKYGKENLILTHDCDYRIDGVQTLVEVEEANDVKSIFFLRPDAEYFARNIKYFQDLKRLGWTIGYHYSCYTKTRDENLALKLFKAQLSYMQRFFQIKCCRAHGDCLYPKDLAKEETNQAWWCRNKDILPYLKPYDPFLFNTYISDSGHKIKMLWQGSSPIMINFHSDWW